MIRSPFSGPQAETAAFGGASVKLFAVDEHEIFCRGIVACLAGSRM